MVGHLSERLLLPSFLGQSMRGLTLVSSSLNVVPGSKGAMALELGRVREDNRKRIVDVNRGRIFDVQLPGRVAGRGGNINRRP